MHAQAQLLVTAAAATEAAPPQGAQGSNLSTMPLKVEFDNESDPEATVISISGPDQTDLLMQLTGAFNALELTVASANIRTSKHGEIKDIFRVVDANDQKVSCRCLNILDTRCCVLWLAALVCTQSAVGPMNWGT